MKQIKPILAIALIVCLLPMPYGYYSLIRFIAMAIFAFFAYSYYEKGTIPLAFTFGALALLFQPFIKIVLGRELWNIVDLIVAVFLIFLWFRERNK